MMNDTVHDLNMPSFGADMAEGTLIEWLVKEGDEIKRGAIIAEIETHKGVIELDVFEDAVVEKLLIKAGEQVKVGTPIAQLSPLSQSPAYLASTEPASNKITTSGLEFTEKQDSVTDTPISTDRGSEEPFILATPAARAFARKQKISLNSVTLPIGQTVITLKMVEGLHNNAAIQPSVSKTTATQVQSKKGFDKEAMRQTISDTVTRSKQQIPHYYLSQRLDISALDEYLHKYNTSVSAEQRILLAAPLLCAIARTLIKNPQLNGVYIGDSFLPNSTVNLANAINLRGGGLVMPVIRDAQILTAETMMENLKQQVSRARNASLRASELSDGSFTVTSIGDRGAEKMFAVIYPPQVAIIALGSPHQDVLVVDGGIQIRSVIEATLAADHRVSDGHIGARLLYQLNQQLQKPEELWTSKH